MVRHKQKPGWISDEAWTMIRLRNVVVNEFNKVQSVWSMVGHVRIQKSMIPMS
jgi:hypothetical protein